MPENQSPDVCRMGVAFIDAQLQSLYIHAALLSGWIENGGPAPDFSGVERLLTMRHAHPEAHTHSEDGMPAKRAPDDPPPSLPSLDDPAERMAFALRVPSTNAILAVADFFDAHRLSGSRTPEVQFLMRIRDAAVNANTLHVETGVYRPHAAYGGIIIDEALDGARLFSDGERPGFMEFGDTVGLLRYLRTLLKSMQTVISSGDAG
ncbi:hypothetical protein [Caballeronia sp. TF1N1]|uniref:hypothetical protein n=1 Tax=Caballeronia sp. TF1N1 TaxID=2878153 RepID=UPI001FD57282|nr:hypothetical protein [Caballeronia sp. TF1N1]